MHASISLCKNFLPWGLGALLACSPMLPQEGSQDFSFAVIDVGQGLCQVGLCRGRAVVWDLGPADSSAGWTAWLSQAGSPPIEAIVISHGDLDHRGGLRHLPTELNFSGLVISSPFVDTALMRAEAGAWAPRLSFRTIHQGDTLGCLPGVTIRCLWPPPEPKASLSEDAALIPNRLSLCFSLRYRTTSVLLTSDIDTAAAKELSLRYATELHSDLLITPHHGSRGSLEPVFYGFVCPAVAIISCGRNNSFGHPHEEVVRYLTVQMGVTLLDTRYAGTVALCSNGEYWR